MRIADFGVQKKDCGTDGVAKEKVSQKQKTGTRPVFCFV
jgi:hypothetical protein